MKTVLKIDTDGDELTFHLLDPSRGSVEGFGLYIEHLKEGEVEITDSALVEIPKLKKRIGLSGVEIFGKQKMIAWFPVVEHISVPLDYINCQDGGIEWLLSFKEAEGTQNWVPFRIGKISDFISCYNPEGWVRVAYSLITSHGYSLSEILSTPRDLNLEGNFFQDTGSGETLGEWAAKNKMILNLPELKELEPDPRVDVWRKIFQEELDKIRLDKKTIVLCAEEIEKRSGFYPNLSNHLIQTAIRPFCRDPDFEVYLCTFGTPDIHFVFRMRDIPIQPSRVRHLKGRTP